ncbi:MAG: hypothetical protein GY832_25325, partial [Chloroflexi bacterium]|nr:hypothetical protein [Chloroflexota bacterium]
VLNRQIDAFNPTTGSPYYETTHVQTVYDENNNVKRIIESKIGGAGSLTDTTINNYDNFDRLVDSTQRGLTVDYAYDDNGNRTRVSTPAGTTNYTYGVRNRLETAATDAGTTIYTYYADGKKDTVTYPNNTMADYDYTAANRIESITHTRTSDQSVISSYTYIYDHNGNRTRQIEFQNGLSETTTYEYDDLDRLIHFRVSGANTEETTYTYEGYNRKTEKVIENGLATKSRSYTYDETDWLILVTDDTDPFNPFTIYY